MSKNWKKLMNVFTFTLLGTLFITACSSDDEDDVTPPGDNDQLSGEVQYLNGTISENTVLKRQTHDPDEADYIMDDDVTVEAQVTIEPGVRIEVLEDVRMEIDEGFLSSEGSESERVLFTVHEPAAGYKWRGIFFRTSDQRNLLQHTRIEHAGSRDLNASAHRHEVNVGVNEGARLSINHSEFAYSGDYGIYVEEEADIQAFENNKFENNEGSAILVHADNVHAMDEASTFSGNGHDGVEVRGGDVVEESTWGKLTRGASYFISEDIDIEEPLTITAGAFFEMAYDVRISVEENGYLNAQGNEGDLIRFTSADIPAGQKWRGIVFATVNNNNHLDYVHLAHGGSSDLHGTHGEKANVGTRRADTFFKISNSMITDSDGHGIAIRDLDGINYDVENNNNQFSNNALEDIYIN